MQYSKYSFSMVTISLVCALLTGCETESSNSPGGGGEGGGEAGGGVGGGSSSSSSSGGSVGGDAEPEAMKGMTEAHNVARANVNPAAQMPLPPLVWSADVAAVAQAYAENCVFEHSSNQFGENLFATTGSASSKEVVDSWVSEVADYDYGSNTCAPKAVCGHYTQVVWADTLRLGCGMANCTKNSPWGSGEWQIWVCNYDPPGNWSGQKPY